MDKEKLLQQIISILEADLSILSNAAKTAHAAATHEECVPDNKYDTTGLEASYVAQGQANRAQEIRQSLDCYRKLELRAFNAETPIRLTALVTTEAEDGSGRKLFLGPEAGGLKLRLDDTEYIVITPESPLGRALLGKRCDDEIKINSGADTKIFTIIDVA